MSCLWTLTTVTCIQHLATQQHTRALVAYVSNKYCLHTETELAAQSLSSFEGELAALECQRFLTQIWQHQWPMRIQTRIWQHFISAGFAPHGASWSGIAVASKNCREADRCRGLSWQPSTTGQFLPPCLFRLLEFNAKLWSIFTISHVLLRKGFLQHYVCSECQLCCEAVTSYEIWFPLMFH